MNNIDTLLQQCRTISMMIDERDARIEIVSDTAGVLSVRSVSITEKIIANSIEEALLKLKEELVSKIFSSKETMSVRLEKLNNQLALLKEINSELNLTP
jgi:hypothetical protein